MLSIIISKIKSIAGAVLDVETSSLVDATNCGYDELVFTSPITFKGQVTNEDGVLVVSGEASGELTLVCDRCGEAFSTKRTVMIEAAYALHNEAPDLAGERDIHSFNGENIDITAEVLKQFFLDLPMKRLCRDDCRGLCPHCGVNLNLDQCSCQDEQIDPRLEILKKFICDSEKGV